MTNEEIKKALKICGAALPCDGCPYKGKKVCINLVKNNARKLIIKQEKEIAQLKDDNRQLKTECTLLDDELRNARQETINVLNKLKEKFKGYEAWYYNSTEEGYHDLEEEIDEVIKELIKNAEDKG